MPDDQTCTFCGRELAWCREPVDHRWPDAAREAYRAYFQREGKEPPEEITAPKCAKGQAWDMRKIGWCVDRAVGHLEWTGGVPHGVSPKVAHNRAGKRKTHVHGYPGGM